MKIFCIIQCTHLGGMEKSALLVLEELKKRGHECEMLSLNPIGELGPLLEKAGIPASGIEYRGKGGWRSFSTLRRRIRETQADALIMVGHNLMTMLAVRRRWGRRQILHIHHHHQGMMPDRQWRLIYRVASFIFPRILFVSKFIRDEALEIAPFLKSSSEIVGNLYPVIPLPTLKVKMEARQRLNIPIKAKAVGNAGWLIPRKRWDIFLQVAARVAKKDPKAYFLIAGDGPERPKLEAEARALGIADRIRWLGWQKDLSVFYDALDVFVFNSDWDAIPRAPLEAMSHAIPVVSSVLHGGLKEMIADSSMGILLPEHDLDKLSAHVLDFLSDPELAARVGKSGRDRMLLMGDPQTNADLMLKALGY